MPVITSKRGQTYAVDAEFDLRLDQWPGVDYVDYDGDDLIVRANLADLLDFLESEGLA